MSPFGKKIVIIGSGLAAYELADFLDERGKRVTLVETRKSLPSGIPPMPIMSEFFLDRLILKGVPMLTGVKYEGITDKGLMITDRQQWLRTIGGGHYSYCWRSAAKKRASQSTKGQSS